MTTSHIRQLEFHESRQESRGRIIRVGPDRRDEAIQRLIATPGHAVDRDRAQRFLQFAKNQKIKLESFWACVDDRNEILFSVLAVPNPGRTAMIFATHPTTSEEIELIGELIDHACRHIAALNINLTQALVEPGEELDYRAYLAGGFTELATLKYLERPIHFSVGRHVPQPAWPKSAKVQSYDGTQHNDLLRVLDESYEDTLDCPGLRGFRRTEDILTGHKSCGLFDRELWTILRIDNEPVGTILLNPSADQKSVELVYVGLRPSARGKGLGTQLLRHAMHLLQPRSEETITLAVDERNKPALTIYKNAGFALSTRRRALIRAIDENLPTE